MNDGVMVWAPNGHRQVRLEYVPFNGAKDDVLATFVERSDYTWPATTRAFGRFGTDRAIRGDGGERDVWRFLVLPQLIETVSQAFVPELLIAKLRQTWIQDNLPDSAKDEVSQAFGDFDRFLKDVLLLEIVQAGHGLSSGLLIEDVVAGGDVGAGGDVVAGEDVLADGDVVAGGGDVVADGGDVGADGGDVGAKGGMLWSIGMVDPTSHSKAHPMTKALAKVQARSRIALRASPFGTRTGFAVLADGCGGVLTLTVLPSLGRRLVVPAVTFSNTGRASRPTFRCSRATLFNSIRRRASLTASRVGGR